MVGDWMSSVRRSKEEKVVNVKGLGCVPEGSPRGETAQSLRSKR